MRMLWISHQSKQAISEHAQEPLRVMRVLDEYEMNLVLKVLLILGYV